MMAQVRYEVYGNATARFILPRPMRLPMRRNRPRVIGLELAVLGLVLSLAASAMPWGLLDVSTKIGPIPVTLKATVREYGLSYEAHLSGAQTFIGGGMIPSNISNEKIYLTGLGEFQETVGFVKGTSKEKNTYTTLYTWPPPRNGTALVKVTARVANIPWWPVGVSQDAGITVELEEAANISEVRVHRAWFELHRTIDGQDRYRKVWESTPESALRSAGDRLTYPARVSADGDYGEFSLAGMVELELRDSFGNSNRKADGSYYEVAAPPKPIALWTVSQGGTARLALLVAAFPATLAGGALSGLAALAGALGRRWAWKLCALGAALSLLAVLFFALGAMTVVDLTGYGEWYSWTPQFFLSPAGGAVTAAAAAAMRAGGRVRGGVPAQKGGGKQRKVARTQGRKAQGREEE